MQAVRRSREHQAVAQLAKRGDGRAGMASPQQGAPRQRRPEISSKAEEVMSDWVHIEDELAAIISRAHGIEAALVGCKELGADRKVCVGVTDIFTDHLVALTAFKERLAKELGKD
jgi:hypothetical protein